MSGKAGILCDFGLKIFWELEKDKSHDETISACSTIDTANLGIKVEEIEFPVEHGTEISYSLIVATHGITLKR